LIDPLVGLSSAVSILKVVLLPAPFNPSRINLSFFLKLNEMDSTAVNVLPLPKSKVLEMFETVSYSEFYPF